MSLSEIQQSVNKLSTSWEDFLERKKSEEIKSKDNLLKIEDISHNIKTINKRLDHVEFSGIRPEKGKNDEKKFLEDYMRNKQLHSSSKTEIDQKSIPLIAEDQAKYSYILTNEVAEDIYIKIRQNSTLRQLCDVQKISSDSLTYVKLEGSRAYWTKEQFNSNHDSETLNSIKIPTCQICAQSCITNSLAEDCLIDMVEIISSEMSRSFSKLENNSFIKGKILEYEPNGILTSLDTSSIIETEKKGDISYQDILKMTYSLPQEYSQHASFLLHRNILQKLQQIKCTETNTPLLQISNTGDTHYSIFGIPVYTCSEMCDNIATEEGDEDEKFAIILADFKATYKIIDRNEITMIKDPFTNKPYITYYGSKRVGGKRINDNSIKVLKVK